jgi:hypothetical protein
MHHTDHADSISLPLSVIHRTEPEMTDKLRDFFYSLMVHFLILINLLLACCGFALAQTCIVSSNSRTVIHGERSSVYVEVIAKRANGLVSAYGMDFSGHDWDKPWEIRSKAEMENTGEPSSQLRSRPCINEGSRGHSDSPAIARAFDGHRNDALYAHKSRF